MTADELINNPAYEAGYQDGESNGNADWILSLELLPFDVQCPGDVLRGFAAMQPTNMTDDELIPYYNEYMRRATQRSR
jgi:hypothetical protein